MTKTKWTKEQIRAARKAHIPTLLLKEAYRLRETGGGNFEMVDHPGLIVKESYWRWPQQDKQGNAIDLLVNVLGRSFSQAMQTITQA